jgi:hypothetical protein
VHVRVSTTGPEVSGDGVCLLSSLRQLPHVPGAAEAPAGVKA